MTALKSFYFEQANDNNDHAPKNWKQDLKNQIKSRQAFKFSYWSQTAASWIGCCCCCIKDRYCDWYRKQVNKNAKFKLASQKFAKELDL